jgi:hypothetical protein
MAGDHRITWAVRQGLPVVLQDCPLLGELKAGTSRPGLFGKWTFEYLASALVTALSPPSLFTTTVPFSSRHSPPSLPSAPQPRLHESTSSPVGPLPQAYKSPPSPPARGQERKDWPAMISAADKNRFLFANLALNVHGGQYHVREPETALMATTFADFVKVRRPSKECKGMGVHRLRIFLNPTNLKLTSACIVDVCIVAVRTHLVHPPPLPSRPAHAPVPPISSLQSALSAHVSSRRWSAVRR